MKMNIPGSISHKGLAKTVENSLIENPLAHDVEDVQTDPSAQSMLDPTGTEIDDDEFWPLSGKPHFHVFLGKSQLKPLYQMIIPRYMRPVLPGHRVPVILTYCSKSWDMSYYGDSSRPRFDPQWKKFAIDSDLKVGDACVFELMEFSTTNLKFRVQILRGDFPSKLTERVNGETSKTPIILD